MSVLKNNERPWYPHSYVYSGDTKIEILQKLETKRQFEKVMPLFDVENKAELLQKLNDFDNPYRDGYQRGLASSIPNIEWHIDLSKICEYR